VTGTRVETTVQDADVAVTVLTSQSLSDARVTEIGRIDDFVPNVQINETGELGSVYINIRGVESNPFIVNRAAVYIDGIPFRELTNSVLSELESVEVLRGPQSTLYGANASSGLIVIRTRAPGEQLEATGRFTVSTFEAGESYVSELYVGMPLVEDKLTASLNVKYTDKATFMENIGATPQGPGKIEEWFFQGRVRYTPFENVEINATAYHINIDAPGVYTFDFYPFDIERYNQIYSEGILFDPTNPTAPPPANGDLLADDYQYVSGAPKYAQVEHSVFGISGKIDTEVGTVSAAFSWHSDKTDDRGFDIDYTNAPILTGAQLDTEEFINAELVFQSLPDEPLAYILGVSVYADEETLSLGSLLDPTGGLDDFVFSPEQAAESEDYGAFASFSYTPPTLEKLTFTVGGRYDVAQRATSQTAGVLDLGFTQFFFEEFELEETFEDFLPRFAVKFEQTDDLTWFAAAAKGYIPGGFNLTAAAEELLGDVVRYDSEELWSYDLGVKWSIPEKRVRTSAAIFFIEANDWQEVTALTTETGQAGSTSLTTADGTIESHGFEFEVEWQPMNELTVSANLGYTNADYVDYAETEPDVVGNPVKFVPEYDANIAVQYRWDSGFFVRAEADLLGRTPLNTGNFQNLQRLGITGRQTQSPTQVFGFQLGYRKGLYSARVFIENITNERRMSGTAFPSSTFPTDGVLYGPVDVPRVVGLELEINY